MKVYKTEDIAEMIREIGLSLIRNAESIAGDCKYQTEIHITFDYSFGSGTFPEITYSGSFIPEGCVKNV